MKNIDEIKDNGRKMEEETSQMQSEQVTKDRTETQEADAVSEKKVQTKSATREFLHVLISALVLMGLIFGVVKIVKHCKAKREYVYCDSECGEEPVSGPIIYRKGKCYIVNPDTKHTIVKDIEWYHYSDSKDSIILFAKNGKRGFCNIMTGKVIVEPVTYTKAWVFSEGLAAVEKDGRIGFVNTDGEEVINCKFSYRGNPLTEFVFNNGHCIVADTTNKIGVIDNNGRWVIQPMYDGVELTQNYAVVYTKGDFKKQIDYNGRVIQEGIIDDISEIYYDVTYTSAGTGGPEEGRIQNMNYYEYTVGPYAGLINSKGQFITPPIYTSIYGITPTLFCATLQDCYSKVFIDQNGNVISRKANDRNNNVKNN